MNQITIEDLFHASRKHISLHNASSLWRKATYPFISFRKYTDLRIMHVDKRSYNDQRFNSIIPRSNWHGLRKLWKDLQTQRMFKWTKNKKGRFRWFRMMTSKPNHKYILINLMKCCYMLHYLLIISVESKKQNSMRFIFMNR